MAYMEPDSPDLIDDTFEDEAARFESDTVSISIFVMVMHLRLPWHVIKTLERYAHPYLVM